MCNVITSTSFYDKLNTPNRILSFVQRKTRSLKVETSDYLVETLNLACDETEARANEVRSIRIRFE